MGKQTRFHPVSLNVIRGAAEFAGFKLGKLRQVESSVKYNSAHYKAQVIGTPQDCQKKELLEIQNKLNSAFSDDVWVSNVWVTPKGAIYAEIRTGVLEAPEIDHVPEDERDWLLEGYGQ